MHEVIKKIFSRPMSYILPGSLRVGDFVHADTDIRTPGVVNCVWSRTDESYLGQVFISIDGRKTPLQLDCADVLLVTCLSGGGHC